jgi:hypothetical protein
VSRTGLEPDAVDVVYAFSECDADLDAVEADALTSLFGGSRTVVTSVKGALDTWPEPRARRRFCAAPPGACH